MLNESGYDQNETQFLENGFRNGFSLEYHGPTERQSRSHNLPFSVGDPIVLWNILMKEVKLKRVAGPFDQIPFDNYIQSPIGLIPKAGSGDQTRLVFHLSYDFGAQQDLGSVNSNTPREMCSVTYNDLDHAVHSILILRQEEETRRRHMKHRSMDSPVIVIYLGKSDIKSAFRVLPLSRDSYQWAVMMVQNPITKKWQYFVDKCLPFGASISCAHFQRMSNAIQHLVKYRTGLPLTNYLDDFLFYALSVLRCNFLMKQFLLIYKKVGIPVALDKTEWASEVLVFLGILLDGRSMTLSIPLEKCDRALYLLNKLADKHKATVKELQTLCGYLNFLGKVIFAGRMFTRRMYAKYSSVVNANKFPGAVKTKLKQYHHVRLDKEFRNDCRVWIEFLNTDLAHVVNRPMLDLSKVISASEIQFYSDASAARKLGFGCIFNTKWIFGVWGSDFIDTYKPSIEYLELFGLLAGILTWSWELKNCRIVVFCDNQAVVAMVNSLTSSCPNCLQLLCILVLNGLVHNRRVFARYVNTKSNHLADSLSQLDFTRFRKMGPDMNQFPDKIHSDIWPITKVWRTFNK